MRKVLYVFAALLASAVVASAQDVESATELYNQAVANVDVDKVQALNQFQEALSLAEACGDQGFELVENCKKVIPGLALQIAKGYINEAQYDQALTSLELACAKANEYNAEDVATEAQKLVTDTYLRKGLTLYKSKDFEGAITALQAVVEADPTNGQAYLILGQSLNSVGRTDEAIVALEAAAANGKSQATKTIGNILLKNGQALLKEGKAAEAVEVLTKAAEYGENANIYKLLASAYTKLGKTTETIEAHKKYLEVKPDAADAPGVLLTIAVTAQKAGDKATAIEYYQKVVEHPKASADYVKSAQAQLAVLKK